MMTISYDLDVIAWANEQAALIRAGRFDLLDIEHIADEIEDVGKSEAREFSNRMAILLAHLLKWQYQPERRITGTSWLRTIRGQRKSITRCLKKHPSLKPNLSDPDWWEDVWVDATRQAENETGILDTFPDACPWSVDEILGDWFPN
jgi:hypothetical protein